ncbi:hypothetical protein [Paenibacillus cineris]|uniref:Uncharacterized protein n=1 Tax=Paenibacillus cineris TaxID=237530 RepID=A0ABQ4LK62_9BACL|nr:hypothetical protein [Paenibacillus cineris]GIO56911.1 hypothetical protein J21TS7_52290 [Paenibacillus cineris]
MKDMSIPLFNNSLLMHWVADYEKSMKLIEKTEIVPEEVGENIKLVSKEEIRPIYDLKKILPVDNKQKVTKEEKARTKGLFLANQARKLYELSKRKAKLLDKRKNNTQEEDNPIVLSHSEKLSCLSIRTDILNYEVRVVVNGRFKWREKFFENIELEGSYIKLISSNCHESVFHIENHLVSGVVHFSSLGFAEGKFYEQEGVKAPDRSELLIIIMKNVAQRVFGISKI